MADTPPAGETATPGDSQTPGTPPAAPVANADNAEVERLRKEKEQADMRVRQLENERKERETKDAEARQKQLEDQEEFKQLYQVELEKRQKLEADQEAAKRSTELTQATEGIFKDYPTEVVELAKTAGLGLSDDSEAAQTALKEKLDAFKARISPGSPEPSSSNPNPSAPAETGNPGGLGKPRSLGVDTGQVTINPEPSKQKIHEYLSALPAIEQMKVDSGRYQRT
jgi:hypothetical protein